MDINYDVIGFISKYHYLEKAIIKTILKDSKKAKIIKNVV